MPASRAEQAYQSIRVNIMDGTYGPGFRLVIDALARDLDMSAVPVRESIRRLEAEGWVTFERNVGAQVAQLDASDWLEGMMVLAVLDGYAHAIAAPHMSDADLRKAAKLNDQMDKAVSASDLVKARDCNRKFHELIRTRCPNRMLVREIDELWQRMEGMRRSLAFYMAGQAPKSVEEHRKLAALIEEGAPARKIEQFAREHRLRLVRAYEADKSKGKATSLAAG